MEWTSKFLLKNISKSNVTINSIMLEAGEERVIVPALYSESAMNQMRLLFERGIFSATNDFVDYEESAATVNEDTEEVETATGTKHTVYSPKEFKKSAIDVQPIDSTSGKAIEVGEIATNTAKAVTVNHDPAVEEAELREFLQQHWRKMESDLKKIDDTSKLENLLSVAIEMNLGGKKVELIQERIEQLNN